MVQLFLLFFFRGGGIIWKGAIMDKTQLLLDEKQQLCRKDQMIDYLETFSPLEIWTTYKNKEYNWFCTL